MVRCSWRVNAGRMATTDGAHWLALVRKHRLVPVLTLSSSAGYQIGDLRCLICAVRIRPAGTDSAGYRLWRHEPRRIHDDD
jgi:hypothetical protein